LRRAPLASIALSPPALPSRPAVVRRSAPPTPRQTHFPLSDLVPRPFFETSNGSVIVFAFHAIFIRFSISSSPPFRCSSFGEEYEISVCSPVSSIPPGFSSALFRLQILLIFRAHHLLPSSVMSDLPPPSRSPLSFLFP